MLQSIVNTYAPFVIIAIALLFACIKFYQIRHKGLHENSMQIFVASLNILSEQEIKNTFHNELKQYYKSSNRINAWFYVTISFLVLSYLFLGYVL